MRQRNSDGTFKSAIDIEIERHEAEWNAEVKAKMDQGMTFDEAWIAAGGTIVEIGAVRAGKDDRQ